MIDYKWQFAASLFFLENVMCSKTLNVAYRTYQNHKKTQVLATFQVWPAWLPLYREYKV